MGFFEKISAPVSGLMNIGSTLIQNNAQKKAQNREFANNTKMWHLANQYNSPEMQMQRLKDAGLNPNLVYGSGSVTGNTSTQTPKYQAPQIHRLDTENFNPMQMLGQYQDLKQRTAQADLTKNQAEMAHKENLYKDLNLAAALNNMQQTGRIKRNDALLKEWLLGSPMSSQAKNSPYMSKYMANVKSAEQMNKIRQFELNFMDQFGAKSGVNSALQLMRMFIK